MPRKTYNISYFTALIAAISLNFHFVSAQDVPTVANSKQTIIINAPFTSQAPFGNWKDQRQQDGCEEASVLMAVRWARNQGLTKQQAEKVILGMANFEQKFYNNYHDTSVKDTLQRLIKGYAKYGNAKTVYDIKISDIVKELEKGNLVIVPANGQKLKNPNFTSPGPERHNLVVKGYDYSQKEFITNDPGTRHGEGYRYKEKILFDSIIDYPTGYHAPIKEKRKAMIVIWR
jgi:hypothetical protein